MRNNILRTGMMLIVVAIGLTSCSNKKDVLSPDVCSTISPKYSTDISGIIQTSCAINSSCHGAGSLNGPGPLLNYTNVNANASSIKVQVVSRRMPLNSALSQSEIDKIKCWIEAGALNN